MLAVGALGRWVSWYDYERMYKMVKVRNTLYDKYVCIEQHTDDDNNDNAHEQTKFTFY